MWEGSAFVLRALAQVKDKVVNSRGDARRNRKLRVLPVLRSAHICARALQHGEDALC